MYTSWSTHFSTTKTFWKDLFWRIKYCTTANRFKIIYVLNANIHQHSNSHTCSITFLMVFPPASTKKYLGISKVECGANASLVTEAKSSQLFIWHRSYIVNVVERFLIPVVCSIETMVSREFKSENNFKICSTFTSRL